MIERLALALFLLQLGHAQSPPSIGSIQIFGLRKVPEAKIRQALRAKEGDPLPPSKGDVEERLNNIEGVVESHLEAVCCDAGRAILYVGIEERGAAHFELRESPDGNVVLPAEIVGTNRRLAESLDAALRRGVKGEDLTHGHSLVADPSARAVQEMLPALADDNTALLRRILRESNDETQRAAAVTVLAYTSRKAAVINDLQFALRDADSGVRNSAAHALGAFAVYQRLNPTADVKVAATWFIEMLNSLSYADRNRAAWALQILTDERNLPTLDQLRERALPALIEMARWKTPEHALPAFWLVGRIAGLTEEQLREAWEKDDRENVILAASKKN